MDPRQEIEQLTRELEYHNRQYYVLDDPKIDDYTYDHAPPAGGPGKANIRSMPANQPTRRVGGEAISAFQKVQHAVPLESLQDVFSLDELREFDARASAQRSRRRNIPCRTESGWPFCGAGVPLTASLSRAAPRAETDSSART